MTAQEQALLKEAATMRDELNALHNAACDEFKMPAESRTHYGSAADMIDALAAKLSGISGQFAPDVAKLLREAEFITASEDYDYPPRVDKLMRGLAAALRERCAAVEDEPVAWLQRHPDGRHCLALAGEPRITPCFGNWSEVPLYTRPQAAAVEGWQGIESAPKLQAVLIHYKNSAGKGRTIKARYVPRWTEVDEGEGECHEYSEEKDNYYLLSGWYEQIDNWDDYTEVFVYETPTLWHPLPTPPEAKR